MSWKAFAEASPQMAAFGEQRLGGHVAYLATTRKDGSPRVHPVTPIIGGGHLFIFMEPTSPKGHDLRRDGRYAMHCSVADSEGAGGEFIISGRGVLVEDPALRKVAMQYSSYQPKDRYILFELSVESASSTVYGDGQPVRQHWKATQTT
jgi:hypothetical protein